MHQPQPCHAPQSIPCFAAPSLLGLQQRLPCLAFASASQMPASAPTGGCRVPSRPPPAQRSFHPLRGLFIGLVAGIATPLLVEVLELALSVDDPSGAISVHLVAGLWGLAATGLFAPQRGQMLAQMLGIATLLGVFLPLVYFVFLLLNRFVPFRVEADGERVGMDLHELGGGAYPEFVIHRDESYR